jgi:serine/threonine protein kinase
MTNLIQGIIGRYRVGEKLQSNLIYSIFQAFDEEQNTGYYLWILFPDQPTTEAFETSFLNRMEILKRLDHPNLLSVLDFGYDTEFLYWVTPVVEGKLIANLDGKSFLEKDAAYICRQIADGVEHLHQNHLFHGHLSPETVIIDDNNSILLFNYGLYDLLHQEITEWVPNRMTGFPLGPLSYLAPEITQGDRASHQVDIYAVGAIYARLLTGKDPYHNTLLADTIIKKNMHPFEWPGEHKHRISNTSIRLIYKCTSLQHEDRYKNMGQIRPIFDRLKSGKGSKIRVKKKNLKGAPLRQPYALRYSLISLVVLAISAAYFLIVPSGNFIPLGFLASTPTVSTFTSTVGFIPSATAKPTKTATPKATQMITAIATTRLVTTTPEREVSATETPSILAPFTADTINSQFVPLTIAGLPVGEPETMFFSPNSQYLAVGYILRNGRKEVMLIDVNEQRVMGKRDGQLLAGYPFSSDSSLLLGVHKGLVIFQVEDFYSVNSILRLTDTIPNMGAKSAFFNQDTLVLLIRDTGAEVIDIQSQLKIIFTDGPTRNCRHIKSKNNDNFLLFYYSTRWLFPLSEETVDVPESIQYICSRGYQRIYTVGQDFLSMASIENNALEFTDTLQKEKYWPLQSITNASAVAISPDNSIVAVGHNSGEVTFLFKNGDDLNRKTERPREEKILDIAFSPNGYYLATISKNGVNIWILIGSGSPDDGGLK